MLRAERDMAKVEKAMESWDEQMSDRAVRQRQDVMAQLRRSIREGRR